MPTIRLSWSDVAPDELYVVREVANLYRVHESTVRRWIDDGSLVIVRTPSNRIKVEGKEILASKNGEKAQTPAKGRK